MNEVRDLYKQDFQKIFPHSDYVRMTWYVQPYSREMRSFLFVAWLNYFIVNSCALICQKIAKRMKSNISSVDDVLSKKFQGSPLKGLYLLGFFNELFHGYDGYKSI